MKIFTKKELLPLLLIIFTFAVGLYLYPALPDTVPTHWNGKGEIDAWGSKDFIVFFFPALILVLYLLITFIPLIDPLRKNYSNFIMPYFWFRTSFMIFFIVFYFYTLSAGFGKTVDINYFALISFSIILIIIGLFLPKIKKNFFVGIRTPWTIQSEEVWDKTHKFGSKVYILAGTLSLLGLFAIEYAFFIFITAAILAAVVSYAYSYFAFRKIKGFE